MDKELEAITRLLDIIKDIVIQNNNLMGVLCEELSPPSVPPQTSFRSDDFIHEIFRHHAENEIAGET
jgi:hypothetical protein